MPTSRGDTGQGCGFWYHRGDVELLVARRSSKSVTDTNDWDVIRRDLELSMAQVEVRELELARARDETERVRPEGAGERRLQEQEMEQLKKDNRRLRAGLTAMIEEDDDSRL